LEGHLKVIFLVKEEIKQDLIIQNQIQIEEVQIEEELLNSIKMNQIEDNLILIKTEMKLSLPTLILKIKNKNKILKMLVKILTAKMIN
jgi:hypothetical protein